MPNTFKQAMPHFLWPTPLQGYAAEVVALLYQLEISQWLSPSALLDNQLKQLKQVFDFAVEYSPYYKKYYKEIGQSFSSIPTLEHWQKLPISTRSQLEKYQTDIFVTSPPPAHGDCYETSSSGSRGKPITVKKTQVCNTLWEAHTLRNHLWQETDLTGKLASIRWLADLEEAKTTGYYQDSWGFDDIFESGESVMMHCEIPLNKLADWLLKEEPDYLVSYPSILDGLAQYFMEHKLALPSLKGASTFGELALSSMRDNCHRAWNIRVADIYSNNEAGYLALQCPEHGNYHVQSENVLIEILNDQDQPCKEGELGKVIISSLNNFATPLLRYDTGDYAKLGKPCACGRGLPVLKEIAGRTRNLVVLPDGSKHRPAIGFIHFKQIAKVKKSQLVQTSLDTIEARLVVEQMLTSEQEQSLVKIIRKAMGYDFEVRIKYWDDIPTGARGKFEEFISFVE